MACESCNQQIPQGTCKDFLNSDCVYISEELTCAGVKANTVLTTALKRLDEYMCQLKNGTSTVVSLISTGAGAKIYNGKNNLGEHQIRSLVSSDNTVSITESGTTLDFSVTVDVPEVTNATEQQAGIAEIATQAEVNTGTDDTKIVTPLKLKTALGEIDTDYTIGYEGGEITLYKEGQVHSSTPLEVPDGIYPESFELVGTRLIITLSTEATLEVDLQDLVNFTQVQADFTQEDATKESYIKNRDPSKTVFSNYTLTPADNNYVIVIDSSAPVVITVPTSLPDKHTTGFIQKGTGLVTIANTDIIPEGLTNTLRGRGHQAYVEKIQGTKFLFGNLNKAS